MFTFAAVPDALVFVSLPVCVESPGEKLGAAHEAANASKANKPTNKAVIRTKQNTFSFTNPP